MSVPVGMLQITDLWGTANNLRFAIRQALNKIQTATLVQVVSCTNDGDASVVGFVDVLILVNQQNSAGVGIQEGQLVNLPYMRMQGGANAIILDPQPGDIGIAVFASRDISTVIATKKQANPATFRTYDFSDGLYIGGVLNGTPIQYVQFNSEGITIVSPNQVTLQIPAGPSIAVGIGGGSADTGGGDFVFNENVDVDGNLKVSSGATGTFSTGTGQTVTVQDGIIIDIS
jgi:hypothetical protein